MASIEQEDRPKIAKVERPSADLSEALEEIARLKQLLEEKDKEIGRLKREEKKITLYKDALQIYKTASKEVEYLFKDKDLLEIDINVISLNFLKYQKKQQT